MTVTGRRLQYVDTMSAGLLGSILSRRSSAISWVRPRSFSTARTLKTRETSLR